MEEANMNKFFLFLVLSLFVIVTSTYAGNIRIPAKGGGLYQVVIVDKGAEGAKYDGKTESIINTSSGTRIRIRDIDFGNARYGLYNQFMIEYTNPEYCEDGFFDIYIEDTAVPVASIPVEQTKEGEYKEVSASLNVNIIGSHAVYVRWRNHSACLKTFGANELVPFTSVELVRTGSLMKYKFSKGTFGVLSGKHRLKMVWRGNNAIVANVYLDKSNITSVVNIEEENLSVFSDKFGFRINAATPIGKVEVYSSEGLKVEELLSADYSEFVSVIPGFYIVRITRGNGEIIVKKILVTE